MQTLSRSLKQRKNKDEALAEVAGWMTKLAKLAYQLSIKRIQLAEFFIEDLKNAFSKEYVARASPSTFWETLPSSIMSKRFFERL